MTLLEMSPQTEFADPVARFGLLASAIADRPLVVATSDVGWTDGRTVFVSADEPRCQVILLSAMLAAGSLDPAITSQLAGRPKLTRRYLAIEGRRVLAGLGGVLPRTALPDVGPLPVEADSPAASLRLARAKADVPPAPAWFGELRPRRVEAVAEVDLPGLGEGLDDPEDAADERRRGKKARSRFGENALSRTLSRLLGTGQSKAGAGDGTEIKVATARMTALRPSTSAVVDPAGEGTTALSGTTGLDYPEWDGRNSEYRPAHCRVVEFLPAPEDLAPLDRPARNDALRRELGRLGLGPRRERMQRMGYDLDLDAAVDAQTVLATGRTPPDTVYVDNLRHARELSVLVLLDASGSGDERTPGGESVLHLQRIATAQLVDTLTELGDRVAAYAFRSEGRQVVFTRLKRFDDPFGTATLHRIGGVEAGGFTRFGCAIRHATHLLRTEGGTARRLLVAISDGFPYDDGYEHSYAEADVRKALDEARARGVGCLCLNLGSSTAPEALFRIYPRTEHATSENLDELVPSLLRLFHGALRRSDLRRRYGSNPDPKE